jgi:hypothetical protein
MVLESNTPALLRPRHYARDVDMMSIQSAIPSGHTLCTMCGYIMCGVRENVNMH